MNVEVMQGEGAREDKRSETCVCAFQGRHEVAGLPARKSTSKRQSIGFAPLNHKNLDQPLLTHRPPLLCNFSRSTILCTSTYQPSYYESTSNTMPALSSADQKMSSFSAAFRADDTLIGILPEFDLDGTLPLLSSVPVGPFKSGIETRVPLWMAVLLQQRSFAVIVPPPWWTTENVARIIAHEKSSTALFPTTTTGGGHGAGAGAGADQQQLHVRQQQLPADYYEISKRLTSTRHPPEHAEAMKLLVEDLFEIRLDKLRQQFQNLLAESTERDPKIQVDGIGTQELALLQSFASQALRDQYALAAAATAASEKAATAGPKKAAGGRSSRSTAGEAAAATEQVEKPAVVQQQQPPVRRLALRKFRS